MTPNENLPFGASTWGANRARPVPSDDQDRQASTETLSGSRSDRSPSFTFGLTAGNNSNNRPVSSEALGSFTSTLNRDNNAVSPGGTTFNFNTDRGNASNHRSASPGTPSFNFNP